MREWIDASRFDAHGEKYPEVEGNRAQQGDTCNKICGDTRGKVPNPKAAIGFHFELMLGII